MLTLTNARLFDGEKMLPGLRSVSLDGNAIAAIEERPGANAGQVFDLGGMTLMPGLITCHLHIDFFKFTLAEGLAGDPLGSERPPGVMMAIAVRNCKVLLESGFTGYVGASCSNDIDASLKMAIAEGIIPGPRIRACGHHIGTTGDLNDSKKWWKRYQSPGTDLFVDGPEAMRALVRDEIRRGVETIKVFASAGRGFGVRERTMSREELAMIVNTAHDRGARVRTHVCGKAMIMECIELGVDIIDHGDGVDEQVIDAMATAGTFWVPSLLYSEALKTLNFADPQILAYLESSKRMLPVAQKAGVRILVGDDYSGVLRDMIPDDTLDHQVGRYGREFAYYAGIDGLSPAEVLTWGTKNAGELLVDAPAKVGVVAPGALADLIVVDGDPLANLKLLSQPEQHLKAVIRDGAFVIDRLPPRSNRAAA